MTRYDEILKDLLWYCEYQLSSAIFWKDWNQQEGYLDPNNNLPITAKYAPARRKHYAESIRTKRTKLRLAKELNRYITENALSGKSNIGT